jgi:hypothetical protein
LYFAYGGLGQWPAALASLAEAAALWQQLDNPAMLSEALNRAAHAKLAAADFAAAESAMRAAYAAAEQTRSPHMLSLSRVFFGTVYVERGELAAGIAIMEEVIALGEQTGNITATIGTRAELALAYGLAGDPATGLKLAELALVASRQFEILAAWGHAAAARLHLQLGDLAAASAHLTGADYRVQRRSTGFMVLMWANLGLAQIELAWRRGETGAAARLAEQLLADMDASQVQLLRPEALALHGRLRLALGQLDTARAQLEAARALAESQGARRYLAGCFSALAEVAAAQPDPAAVAQWQAAANQESEWLAAHAPPHLRAALRKRYAHPDQSLSF